MLKLPVSHLVSGMQLARPVYGTRGEKLLNKGVELTAAYVMALRRRGVLAVYVGDPVNEVYEDILEEEVRINAMEAVRAWVDNDAKQKNLAQIIQSVETIVEEILAGKQCVNGLTEICTADAYTYMHSVDVCVLSLAVGVKLGFTKKDLIRLGTGSILHDLGKTRVPPEILNKPGKLTPEEFAEIKKHPVLGYKMLLSQTSEIDPVAASIVLNHHERYDGSGYPQGLKGSSIGTMPTICAVADVYNAITTDRVYRPAFPPHEAYEMLMASGNSTFDSRIVNTFLTCVSPYPVGSLIKLSNGFIARVKKTRKNYPFRPIVSLLNTDSKNTEIDLIKENSIVITGVVGPSEVCMLTTEGRGIVATNSATYGA